VDSDVIDKLIEKEDLGESKLTEEEKEDLREVFLSAIPERDKFMVIFENLSETDSPVMITQSEFMRRMKDMSALGGEAGIYGNFPDSFNLVINANHPLVKKVIEEKEKKTGARISKIKEKIEPLKKTKEKLEKANKDKKQEEIPQADKDRISELEKKIGEYDEKRKEILRNYATKSKRVRQMIDLALLANNMLRGEKLNAFVKRSIELL